MALQKEAEQRSAGATALLADAANEAARGITLDEADARRLIDAQLREAGWEVDSVGLTHGRGARPVKGRSRAIAEWPTAKGVADYVLFVGLRPVATVEAKRRNRDVSAAIDQAKRYGRDYRPAEGEASSGGPWGGFMVPFVFAASGRPYLKQITTLSGVWFCDVRRPENHRRALDDWYTPEGLTALLERDEGEAHERLRDEGFAYDFGLRDYQTRAIRAVEAAVEAGRRELLVAMATGTGKTKTWVALVYRLLKAKRFRRVLFLVDRTALGDQAGKAFTTTRIENGRTFAEVFGLKEIDKARFDPDAKLHVMTVQGLVKRVLFPEDGATVSPVDAYDCVVIDECHRGYLLDRKLGTTELGFRDERDYVSKYRRVLEHFDAVKIGLTATPALHTVEIFGEPVYRYTYREAVVDGWLIDHEPPLRLYTELSERGIAWKRGEAMEVLDTRAGTIDLVRAPDDVAFDVTGFNRMVLTESFNRVVCAWLATHIDPSLPGKTLVFCATDRHADMVTDALKAAMAEAYGEIEDEAIRKITGAIDRPLAAIKHVQNESLPKIAVTVDLLTTGVDVPKITNLVFIRPVTSRILYEQMLGRATRLCPEIDKAAFRVFDAVGVYAAMQDVTEMRPVAATPNTSFAALAADLGRLAGDATEEGRTAALAVRDRLIGRRRRRARRMTEEHAAVFARRAGMTPDALIDRLRAATPAEAAALLDERPGLVERLDRGGDGPPVRVPISHHPPTWRARSTGPSRMLAFVC